MNAKEWLAAKSPYPMFDYLGRTVSPRKLRLFGIACCRRIWSIMTYDKCRDAVMLAERYVEGKVSRKEITRMSDQLRGEYLEMRNPMNSEDKESQVKKWCLYAANNVLQDDDSYLRDARIRAGDPDLLWVWKAVNAAVENYHFEQVKDPPTKNKKLYAEELAQANLLREVLGNPLSPIQFDKSWRSANVKKLAQNIYEKQKYDQMSLLAAPLKKAGCTEKDILDHCCGKEPHVCGCWVLDLILGNSAFRAPPSDDEKESKAGSRRITAKEAGYDFDRLRYNMVQAARRTFKTFRDQQPGEQFYAFALTTDDDATGAQPAANTEESFQRAVAQYAASGSKVDAGYLRFSPDEWAYEGAEGNTAEWGKIWEMNGILSDEAPVRESKMKSLETMILALKDLDKEGFFGRGAQREAITLMIWISGSAQAERWQSKSVKALNPIKVQKKFRAEWPSS